MADEKVYFWTAQDQVIAAAQGDPDGKSMQGPFVTPYGWAPKPGHKAQQPGVATTFRDPLAGPFGEIWRAQRFFADQANPQDPSKGGPYYAWELLDKIPDGVKTLGELCKSLCKDHPQTHPETVYGDGRIERAKDAKGEPQGGMAWKGLNTPQTLFDYIGNSQYRWAVLADPDSWHKYKYDPGSLPVEATAEMPDKSKGTFRLRYVLECHYAPPRVPAAPNTNQSVNVDPLDKSIESFIAELNQVSDLVTDLINTSETEMARRFELLRRLNALSVLASVSEGLTSDWSTIVHELGSTDGDGSPAIMPKARAFLSNTAVKHKDPHDPRWMEDVQSLMRDAQERLDRLVHKDAYGSFPNLKKWAALVIADMNTVEASAMPNSKTLGSLPSPGAATRMDQLDRLCGALAWAHTNLGQGETSAGDDLLRAYENLPKERMKHADSPEEAGSPNELIFQLIGNLVTLVPTVYGNLPGPPSLHVAYMMRAGAKWARTLKRTGVHELLVFARRICDDVPAAVYSTSEVKLAAADLKRALIDFDSDSATNLWRGTDARYRGFAPVSVHEPIDNLSKATFDAKATARYRALYKNSISVLFQIVATVAALHKCEDDLKTGDGYAFVPDFVSFFGNMGTTAVDAAGMAKDLALETRSLRGARIVKALAGLDAEALKFAGCVFGTVTAIAGIATGIVDLVEGFENKNGPDYYKMVGGLLEIIGGGCMAFVAISAWGGAATGGTLWVVEAVGVACMVFGGVISLHGVIAAVTWPASRRWAYALVKSLRGSAEDNIPPEALWAKLEKDDDSVKSAMDRVVSVIETGAFSRPDPTDTAARHRLFLAGVPLPVIAQIFADTNVSSGGASSSASTGSGATAGGEGGARAN